MADYLNNHHATTNHANPESQVRSKHHIKKENKKNLSNKFHAIEKKVSCTILSKKKKKKTTVDESKTSIKEDIGLQIRTLIIHAGETICSKGN